MRTWDSKIGEEIIKIVYRYEPVGIRFNELKKISGYAKNTIDRWLNRLREFGIIEKIPKYPIHLTKAAIQQYRTNSLMIPPDLRKYTIKEKNLWRENDKKSLILILSLMALGVYKPRRYNKPTIGLYEIQNPVNPRQFFMYGGKTIHSISLNDVVGSISPKRPDAHNKRAFLPNTKINYGNNELFGYLNLTIEEAHQIFYKLLNHNSPIIKPLKIKCKTQSEMRYTIADDLLKEFITNCILSFNVYVKDRLVYAYIYDLFYPIKKVNNELLKKGNRLRNTKNICKSGMELKERLMDILQ
ncbi:MAG: hypothetical protein K0S93_1036 [Nitrososphaeraceae archaeon]|nr:hypothetical protein [Nitrososphaeraceae archaeon]